MQFQTYSKNLFVTESLQQYLDMKMSHLDRINAELISCRVDLSRDAHHKKGDVFRVEINMNVPGRLLRIVEQDSDVRAAIDVAVDRLLRQAKKFKSKRLDVGRRLARFMKRFRKT